MAVLPGNCRCSVSLWLLRPRVTMITDERVSRLMSKRNRLVQRLHVSLTRVRVTRPLFSLLFELGLSISLIALSNSSIRWPANETRLEFQNWRHCRSGTVILALEKSHDLMETNDENRLESCGTRLCVRSWGFRSSVCPFRQQQTFYFWNRFSNLFKFLCISGSPAQNPDTAPPFTECRIFTCIAHR